MANRTCSVDGCDRKHYAKSYCEACYKRVKATGSTAYREYPKVPCAASECAEVAVAKGLCKRCYQRNRTGTLGLPKRTGAGEPMRWLQQMVAVGNRDSGCWLWPYGRTTFGYGVIAMDGRQTSATHAAMREDGRPRPDGMFALHSCDNPPCVNPDHLRWGDHAENMQEMIERGRHVPRLPAGAPSAARRPRSGVKR